MRVVPRSGEPDIYVSKADLDQDPHPTKNKLTWAAYADGDYNLTISHWDPESSPGWYYIGIYDDCSKQSQTASYSIRAYTRFGFLNFSLYLSQELLFLSLQRRQRRRYLHQQEAVDE